MALVVVATDESAGVNDVMTFRTTDKGLPWPLPDLDNYGLLSYHGVHCVQMLLSPHHHEMNDDERTMHRMHQEHCAGSVRAMLDYVQSVPNYSVPKHVCMDMRETETQAEPVVESTDPRVEEANQRVRRAYVWGSNRPQALKTDDSARVRVVRQTNDDDQYNQFVSFEANNFARLLMTEQRGAPLTPAEATYIRKLTGPKAVRIGATGVYCQYGTSAIQTMSKAIQTQQQNSNSPTTATSSTSEHKMSMAGSDSSEHPMDTSGY